jgi:predicted oxidoreductase
MKKKEIIYGCMNMGGSWTTSPLSNEDLLNAEKALFAALESGITRFDHADIYCKGKSEAVFGQILKRHPELRSKIHIQSKAGIQLHQGLRESNTYNFSRAYINETVDEIVNRLNIEYLDMFLFHRPDPLTSPEEFAEISENLILTGKVKSIGVSNMPPSLIHLFNSCSKHQIVANQIRFSLNRSEYLNEMTDYGKVSTFDSGLFAASFTDKFEVQAWGPLDNGLFLKSENSSDLPLNVSQTNRLLKELSEKYNTNHSAILLAWIFKLPYNLVPIIGTTKPERIKDCTDSLNIDLSREDWYNLWISARCEKLQ